jgi:RHS repeat-associated protein
LSYVHQDHLGSTSKTTINDGSLESSINYYAFGLTRIWSGSLPDKLFTGQRKVDSNATDGLYYYGARYYDAAIGRFLSPDTIVPNPMNPQSLNRYSYCLNNPLKYTDPSGHDPLEDYLNELKGCGVPLNPHAEASAFNFWQEQQGNGGWDPEKPLPNSYELTRSNGERVYPGGLTREQYIANQKAQWLIEGFLMYTSVVSTLEALAGVLGGLAEDIEISLASKKLAENATQDLKFSQTVLNHLGDISKAGKFARPYSDSVLLVNEIMNSGVPVPDAFLSNGLKWEVPGTFNGNEGIWELVVDKDTNTVVHLLFK